MTRAPKIQTEAPINISNCNFEMKPVDDKAAEILLEVAQALHNITKIFEVGRSGMTGISIEQIVRKNGK